MVSYLGEHLCSWESVPVKNQIFTSFAYARLSMQSCMGVTAQRVSRGARQTTATQRTQV